MNKLGKKTATGALAAAILLGGGIVGLNHSPVFASETAGTATKNISAANQNTQKAAATDPSGENGRGKGPRFGGDFGRGGKGILEQAATALGVDAQTVKDQVKAGKTLVDIAKAQGVTEDALLEKLTTVVTKEIDAAVTAGKLTQDQADKNKTDLAARLKETVESTDLGKFEGKGRGGRGGFGHRGFSPFGDPATLSGLIGITEDELRTQQQAGKTLAEIAAAKGITEDQLIAKLKDNLTDELKEFVQSKGKPFPAKADADNGDKAASDAASNS